MAAPDYSDGCMIALYPPAATAKALAVDGGLPPDDMHVTVAYLGDASEVDPDVLRTVVEQLAERQAFTAQISGAARFTGGDKDVIVALIDSADLEDLRRDTLDALHAQGIEIPRDHGYTSHCTLSYLDADEPSPIERLPAEPMHFAALSAVHGTNRTDIPLAHPVEAPAREAFAAGWAASGGPMTDRVRAACAAAVQTAVEHADDPHILEVTLDLGKLEGMWALLFARREEQQRTHTAMVSDAWRPMIDRAAVADMVDHFRQRAGLTEARIDWASILAEARAAARAMLNALADHTGWTRLRTAIRNALAAGRAEGIVNAVAIAAERSTTAGLSLDWNIAFKDAYQSLERLDELWGDADGWLGRMLDRATEDLGRTLAQAAEDGVDRDAMIDAAMDVLTTGDRDAVAFTVDWAMTTAADEGARTLYQSEGVAQIDIITAGDGRVCQACDDAESGSPWAMADAPRIPLHPLCRCVPAADLSLSHFATWFA